MLADSSDGNDQYPIDIRSRNEKGFFISPYVMWKIKLIKDDSIISNTDYEFDELKQFKRDQIDLKLVGQGQYFTSNNIGFFRIWTEIITLLARNPLKMQKRKKTKIF